MIKASLAARTDFTFVAQMSRKAKSFRSNSALCNVSNVRNVFETLDLYAMKNENQRVTRGVCVCVCVLEEHERGEMQDPEGNKIFLSVTSP